MAQPPETPAVRRLRAACEEGRLFDVILGVLHIQARMAGAVELLGRLEPGLLDHILALDFAKYVGQDLPRPALDAIAVFRELAAGTPPDA